MNTHARSPLDPRRDGGAHRSSKWVNSLQLGGSTAEETLAQRVGCDSPGRTTRLCPPSSRIAADCNGAVPRRSSAARASSVYRPKDPRLAGGGILAFWLRRRCSTVPLACKECSLAAREQASARTPRAGGSARGAPADSLVGESCGEASSGRLRLRSRHPGSDSCGSADRMARLRCERAAPLARTARGSPDHSGPSSSPIFVEARTTLRVYEHAARGAAE